jgi:hypothetical protein
MDPHGLHALTLSLEEGPSGLGMSLAMQRQPCAEPMGVGSGIGRVALDDHVEVVDCGFHSERGEKVVDAQHMALDGDRGIRLCLPFTCAAGTQS